MVTPKSVRSMLLDNGMQYLVKSNILVDSNY
jgi:hypothetical protein